MVSTVRDTNENKILKREGGGGNGEKISNRFEKI